MKSNFILLTLFSFLLTSCEINITSSNEEISNPEDDYFKMLNDLFNVDYQYWELVIDSRNADDDVLTFHSLYKILKNDDVFYKVDYVNGEYAGIELLSKDGKRLEVIEGERIVLDINLLLVNNYFPEVTNLDNYTIGENRLDGTVKDVSMFLDYFPKIEASLSIQYKHDMIVSYNLEFVDNGIKTTICFSSFTLS